MNSKIDDLMYEAGLTAQGCWDHMDEYDRTAIMKFAELIVKECAELSVTDWTGYAISEKIKQHFGVEE